MSNGQDDDDLGCLGCLGLLLFVGGFNAAMFFWGTMTEDLSARGIFGSELSWAILAAVVGGLLFARAVNRGG